MNKIYSFLIVAILAFSTFGLVLANPNGAATVTPGASSRAGTTAPQDHDAIAGNLTELTIYGNSITQTWQGYYGNVSGAIRLADSSGNPMYNWSIASPSGEIFASTANSITWASIECFNWTADGTTLETAFNIPANAADGVNETFATGNAHDGFFVGATEFVADDCMSTRIFDDTGLGVNNYFEEVLLNDGANTVFTALLEKDELGFDGNSHDFEMLVLEDGHGTNVATTQYFFYIELS